MHITVRKVNRSDFAEITELLKQLWPGKCLDRDKLSTVFDQMIEADEYDLVCAEKGQEIVGFASLAVLQNFWQEGLIMYITTMIVDEKHRGRGIGKTLMARIAEIARQRGCAKIELESAFHRTDAHAFYEKMGFEKRAYFFSKDIL
ncbi:MAG: hypothetical protein A2010_13950 [Nitrospirae bacterium GWD2_57_9]|nr:MAG: hypothetical protein A2010_13950 [Nitrospirae bacterium GWD2_57_9]